jgi:hypothetical protein
VSDTVNFLHSTSVKNENRVPVKVWRRWRSARSRVVFNDVYSSLVDNKEWLPPLVKKTISPQHLKVLAWNAAWISAEAAEDFDKRELNSE